MTGTAIGSHVQDLSTVSEPMARVACYRLGKLPCGGQGHVSGDGSDSVACGLDDGCQSICWRKS
jgi:hypothetical protein